MPALHELEIAIPDERKNWGDIDFSFRAVYELVDVSKAENPTLALVKPIITLLQWGTMRGFPFPQHMIGIRYRWGEKPLEELIVNGVGKIADMRRNMYNPLSAISDYHGALSLMVEYGNNYGGGMEDSIMRGLIASG